MAQVNELNLRCAVQYLLRSCVECDVFAVQYRLGSDGWIGATLDPESLNVATLLQVSHNGHSA